MPQAREKELINLLCDPKNAAEIAEKHDLDKENVLVLKELSFLHGRADVVIYGLYRDLYVVPIGVEVKSRVMSGIQLLQYITQIRETYEYAFIYTCLAVGEASKDVKRLAEKYLSKLGYCFIEVRDNSVEVIAEASPRKVPRDEHDYNRVVSRGLLYLATKQALLGIGYKIEEIKATSQWIGSDHPITYYSAIVEDHAVVGLYALGLDNAERLLSFLVSNEELLKSLARKGYRMYLETYSVLKGVVGYMRFFDEPANFDVLKILVDKLKSKSKPAQIPKKWGLGFGVYKRLWSISTTPPSYPTVLSEVKKALSDEELGVLEELIRKKA